MTNAPHNQYPVNPEEDAVLNRTFVDESEISFGRQREIVTNAVGTQLDGIFDRHAAYTAQDEDGTRRVSLRVQMSSSAVPAHVTLKSNEDGSRTAFMWLHPGKALGTEMYKYTDGPNITSSLEPYKFDTETGQPVPKTASEHYDPNTDKEVTFWGKTWVRNLRECQPIMPNSREVKSGKVPLMHRALGRLGLR